MKNGAKDAFPAFPKFLLSPLLLVLLLPSSFPLLFLSMAPGPEVVVDLTALGDLELIDCFKKGWKGKQREFCHQFDVSEPTLSQYLNRKVSGSPKSRRAIICWLNKRKDDLFINQFMSQKVRRHLLLGPVEPDNQELPPPPPPPVDPVEYDDQELIDHFRAGWDKTQSEFCQQFDVSEPTLSQYLNRKVSGSPKSRRAIIRWLNKRALAEFPLKQEANNQPPPPPVDPIEYDDQELIDHFRDGWDKTQSEFCQEYEINDSIFSKYLNGKVKTSLTAKRAIKRWLGTKSATKTSGEVFFPDQVF